MNLPSVLDPDDVTIESETKMFYVTVRDGSRVGFLAGPYRLKHVAEARVDWAKRKANEADSFAAFYSFGVSRWTGEGDAPVAVFNDPRRGVLDRVGAA